MYAPTAILLLFLAAPADGASNLNASSSTVPNGDAGHQVKLNYPGATEVSHCTFEPARNEEIFDWPPGWTRRHGPGFPRYVRLRVDDERPPSGGHCLRVELNGGAASAFGQPIAVEPGVDYVLEGYVKTSGLRHDAAWLTLSFFDSAKFELSKATSDKIEGTTDWRKVRIGPVSPPPAATQMKFGVHVAPKAETEDLHGTISFGSLWVGRLPRMILTARIARSATLPKTAAPISAETPFLVFARGNPIDIACLVSGLTAPKFDVRLMLDDADGHTLARHLESFPTTQSADKSGGHREPKQQVGSLPGITSAGRPSQAVPFGDGQGSPSHKSQAVSEQTIGNAARSSWQIPGDSVGFFRVRAEIVSASAENTADREVASCPQATLSLAIIDPEPPLATSEFGWSLGVSDSALAVASLGDLVGQSGIHWVKFPFVCLPGTKPPTGEKPAAKSTAKSTASRPKPDPIEPLISFSDRLADADVQLVGVLHPPATNAAPGQPPEKALAAEVFAGDPKSWYPSIEPVLARLATDIRFWQIGDDCDTGWVGCADLSTVVSRVKTALDQIGQDVGVGVAWDLEAPLPVDARGSASARSTAQAASGQRREAGVGDGRRNESHDDRRKPGLPTSNPQPPWRFLSLPCEAAMTDAALAARLDNSASAGVARWLTIDALPRRDHTGEERVAHLIARLLTAKLHGAEGIFFAQPLDPECGLAGRDGSPSELFLPWRTTALMLGGASYAGDIDLVGGSRINCFRQDGRYVGVIAGGPPLRETVYLGDKLQSRDLWGRVVACAPTLSVERTSQSVFPQSAGQPSQSVASQRDDLGGPSYTSAPQSLIEVQRLPLFLTGLDAPITDWQLNTAFAPNTIQSIPASLTPVALNMKNTFRQVVSGRVQVIPPRNWRIQPRSAEFHLDAGAAWKLPLEAELPNDVVGGRQMIVLEFEIQADRLYRFTMCRPIEVTLGDIALDGHVRLSRDGVLEVRQTLTNLGKRAVGFRCDLLAPDRPRQSMDALLPPAATSDSVYRLPDGRELLGKTLWLRAEEIDGPRVLNYRLDAPPK